MYRRILVAADGSDCSRAAFDDALRLAKQLQAELHLLTVVNLYDFVFEEAGQRDENRLRLMAEKAAQTTQAPMLDAARLDGVQARPDWKPVWGGGALIAREIAAQADAIDADLVVLGTHGRTGLQHLLIGSVAETVLRTIDLPVLLRHDKGDD